jgi:hypothetical protein
MFPRRSSTSEEEEEEEEEEDRDSVGKGKPFKHRMK